jgi:hypothetical protein
MGSFTLCSVEQDTRVAGQEVWAWLIAEVIVEDVDLG